MSPVFHCIYNPNWRWVILSVFLWRLGKTTVMLTCRRSQQRPDHCKLGERIICMNCGSRSKSTSYMSWWSSRRSNGLFWSCTSGKGPHKGIIENQENRKVGVSETHASGNREASTHNDWWKANWWNKYQQEGSRRTWNDEVWEFFLKRVFCTYTFRTQTTNWRIFFVKMVMEW